MYQCGIEEGKKYQIFQQKNGCFHQCNSLKNMVGFLRLLLGFITVSKSHTHKYHKDKHFLPRPPSKAAVGVPHSDSLLQQVPDACFYDSQGDFHLFERVCDARLKSFWDLNKEFDSHTPGFISRTRFLDSGLDSTSAWKSFPNFNIVFHSESQKIRNCLVSEPSKS